MQKGQRALAAAAAAVAAQKALADKADKSAKEAEEAQAAEESRVLVKALDLVKEEDGRPILAGGVSGGKRKTMEEIKEERARAKKQKQEEKEQAREMRIKEKEELKEKKNQVGGQLEYFVECVFKGRAGDSLSNSGSGKE